MQGCNVLDSTGELSIDRSAWSVNRGKSQCQIASVRNAGVLAQRGTYCRSRRSLAHNIRAPAKSGSDP